MHFNRTLKSFLIFIFCFLVFVFCYESFIKVRIKVMYGKKRVL